MIDEIHVKMTNGKLRCFACDTPMTVRNVCMLLRHAPGGPFDPICLDCAHEIIRGAAVAIDTGFIILDYPE